MKHVLLSLGIIALVCTSASAQIFGRRATVSATGTASVTIKPDYLRINVGVTTQGATAQEASDSNASIATAVLAQLQQLIGSTGAIKTVSYSLVPNYKYPTGGGTPAITGYTATNTVQVSTSDLSLAGKIIDTSTKAGATTIGSPSFTLKDPDPAYRDALRLATAEARAHAEAIASGLGMRVGAIISADEGSVVRAVTANRDTTAGASAPTPIESGTLEVSATVTIQAEMSGY